MSSRRGEISAALEQVRRRITAACERAGRDPAGVTLIAVTKTRPVSDIVALTELGVRDIGENRDQEARPKADQLSAAGVPLTWHFVGQLQTRKVPSVLAYADVVHSVDRLRLAGTLATRARAAGRPVTCLIQVSLNPDARPAEAGSDQGRGGAHPDDVPALAEVIAAARSEGGGLVLGGVMAVAPLGVPPADAFARLGEVAAGLRSRYPAATIISAGMSGDLEEAIRAGATHVRIGTALLGGRPAFLR